MNRDDSIDADSDPPPGEGATQGLQAEIDALKARIGDTRLLYREVCALLFFQHGITPTANRLYQLVRRGSMSTPAQVLRRFWAELREHTRVRVEQPDLPAEFREAGGVMLVRLWQRAIDLAERDFGAMRQESARKLAQAQAAAAQAEARWAAAQAQIDTLMAAQAAGCAREQSLVRELASCQGRLASTSEMLQAMAGDIAQLRLELARAQRDRAQAIGENPGSPSSERHPP